MTARQLTPQTAPPIAEIPGIEGRKEVRILECGEPFIALTKFAPDYLVVLPQYALQGYRTAVQEVFVRERVAVMLRKAAESLPSSHRLMIWDAWRPLELQWEIFEKHRNQLRHKHPEWDDNRVNGETEAYVSLPSADPLVPPPHSTGGAVDLTICDAAGQPIEMGTDYDHFGPEAAMRYFEERRERGETLTVRQLEALYNRRFLYWIMTMHGFTSYREEWWHFDYGDQFWAAILGKISIYDGRNTVS